MKIQSKQRVLITALVLMLIGLAIIASATWFTDGDGRWKDRVESIGLALFTAGFLTILVDRITLATLVDEVVGQVEKTSGAHERRQLQMLEASLSGHEVRQHGIRSFEPGVLQPSVRKALEESQTATIVQTWIPDAAAFLGPIKELVKRGGTAKIYLLDPDSCFSRQRSIDLGQAEDTIPAKTRIDRREIRTIYEGLNEEGKTRLNLYYYESLPAFAIYQTDHLAWIGLYWHGLQSDQGTTLVVDVPSAYWKLFEDHLKNLKVRQIDLGAEKAPASD